VNRFDHIDREAASGDELKCGMLGIVGAADIVGIDRDWMGYVKKIVLDFSGWICDFAT